MSIYSESNGKLQEKQRDELDGWITNQKLLFEFVSRVAIRNDCHGAYSRIGKPWTCKEPITISKLSSHFVGIDTIGIHVVTPGDDRAKVLVFDIDLHDEIKPHKGEDQAPPADPKKNLDFALHIYGKYRELGLDCLLFDSNGKGGFHVWVVFDTLVEAGKLRAFGLWLVSDAKALGVATPEVFPKQSHIKPNGFGNWVRLPGKHHKREFFTKVWDGAQWLAGDDAAKRIGNYQPQPITRIPAEALCYTPPPRPKSPRPASWQGEYNEDQWWLNYSGDLKTLDIEALFQSRDMYIRAEQERHLVHCPWEDLHTSQNEGTAIWKEDGRYPGFNCFHAHCEGKTIEDVLAFFGKAAVDAHCAKCFVDDGCRAEEIEQADAIIGVDSDEKSLAETGDVIESPTADDKQLVKDAVALTVKRAEDQDKRSYHFAPLSSKEFAGRRYDVEWLVKRLLVKNQPCILGGPKKTLKTTLAEDLAISLGTGTPFLGEFEVPSPVRTAFISGESGEWTLQETAFRICKSKGIALEDVDVWWDFRLPQLAQSDELNYLKRGLSERQIEVVVIDPLYLCLLSGEDAQGKSASNLFDMGPLLLNVATACLSVGATPILAAHARKNIQSPHEPIGLEDLAFSGIQEFARQWLLINRRSSFKPGTGCHELWMTAGGSCGHGGVWGIDANEGSLGLDFSGRTWDVEILNHGEVIKRKKTEKEERKDQVKEEEDTVSCDILLRTLDGMVLSENRPPSKTALQEKLAWGATRYRRVLGRLTTVKTIEVVDGFSETGKGAKKKAEIVRRVGA